MQRGPVGAALCAFLLAAASACGGADEGGSASETTGPDGSAGAASCAFVVRYQGELYTAWGVEIVPPAGRPLGAGVLPGCDDGHGASGDEEIELAELPGVPPGVAVLALGFPDMVLVREGLDAPAEVEALSRAPRCDPADEPIELAGPWLSVAGREPLTPYEPDAPSHVELLVETSSAPRYERAYLTVRVPLGLKPPLTEADLESSLRQGGTIALRAHCRENGGFVADEVSARPPAD
jgi:hypothetical protein